MHEKNLVSVVILNYNKFYYTVNCINSVLEKTKNTKIEIILVDNASDEDDPAKFKEKFPNIHLICNKENFGFARGCNIGIANARGNYILLLNNDTNLVNDAISIVKSFLDSNSSVGVATCRIENPDGTPQHNCQPFPYRWKQLLELSRLHKFLPYHTRAKILWGPYFKYDFLAYPDWVWGTFFMFRRDILKHFPDNMLPETFWMYVEDLEWCWIIRKAKYQIAFIPEAIITHFNLVQTNRNNSTILSTIKKNYNFFKKNIFK